MSPEDGSRVGRIAGQYLEAKVVLMEQAAELLGMHSIIAKPGQFLTNSEGREFKVDKGYNGIVIPFTEADQVPMFWTTVMQLEEAAKEV